MNKNEFLYYLYFCLPSTPLDHNDLIIDKIEKDGDQIIGIPEENFNFIKEIGNNAELYKSRKEEGDDIFVARVNKTILEYYNDKIELSKTYKISSELMDDYSSKIVELHDWFFHVI